MSKLQNYFGVIFDGSITKQKINNFITLNSIHSRIKWNNSNCLKIKVSCDIKLYFGGYELLRRV